MSALGYTIVEKPPRRGKRPVRAVTVGSETLSIREWAVRYNISEHTLRSRLDVATPLAALFAPTAAGYPRTRADAPVDPAAVALQAARAVWAGMPAPRVGR